MKTIYTGARCGCKPGQQRDNCPACEGTGRQIDFAAMHAARPCSALGNGPQRDPATVAYDAALGARKAPDLAGYLQACVDQMEQCEKMFRDDAEFMAALNDARAALKAAE